MATVIDSSFADCAVTTGVGVFAGVKFRVQTGWKARKYEQKDIREILSIDSEQYRSAGKAAAGAIIGGVLTGGIGLLVGAAIGGRRRKEASYLIRFSDGEYIAITETDGNVMHVLDSIVKKAEVQGMAGQQAERNGSTA